MTANVRKTRTPARPARRTPEPASSKVYPFAGFMDAAGAIDFEGVTRSFHMSKAQLAETAGLGRDTLQKEARRTAAKTQARVGEMLEILGRVEAWAGGRAQAMAWYRGQPIAALDGRTAEALVKSGKAAAVRDYLDHIAMGGFA